MIVKFQISRGFKTFLDLCDAVEQDAYTNVVRPAMMYVTETSLGNEESV